MISEQRRIRSISTHGTRAVYCREKDLPRLTGLWPGEINSANMEDRQRIVGILKNALRLERQRGKSGHWCYDINRHLALKQALTCEQAELKELSNRKRKSIRYTSPRESVHNAFAKNADSAATAQNASSHPVLFLVLPTASSS